LEQEGHIRLNFSGNGDSPTLRKELGRVGQPAPHDSSSPVPFLPFAQGNFRTASGKALLYNQAIKSQGLDPVAAFVTPQE
jgi:hypothetical protein